MRNCGIHFADDASSCELLHPQQKGVTFRAEVSTLNFAPTLRTEQVLTRKQTHSLLMSFKPKYFCPKISSRFLTACEPAGSFMIRTTKGESKICLHKANTATLPGKRSLHGQLQALQLLTSAKLLCRHTLKEGTRVVFHSGDFSPRMFGGDFKRCWVTQFPLVSKRKKPQTNAFHSLAFVYTKYPGFSPFMLLKQAPCCSLCTACLQNLSILYSVKTLLRFCWFALGCLRHRPFLSKLVTELTSFAPLLLLQVTGSD